ncbi:MAG: 6-phosphofructokinase [Candidatus Wallbacteria bacterium]|nr:6-phosphofructokinase [Candidatus Wallbacteria bacterium]
MQKIGILTGGGDCPGLNAVIRAVVRKAINENFSVVGFKNGWMGVTEGTGAALDMNSVSGILPKGGTILGTSRTNPVKAPDGLEKIKRTFDKFELHALIAIGGEDTLGVARKLHDAGLNVVGVPKTIDNDLQGTDFTFGFDTAVNIATMAIDRLHTTAEAHNRVMVVEVMGRHAGWIAVYAGLAGGADCILIPEEPFDIDQVCELLKKRHSRGKNFSIVVVAEGAKLAEQEGGLVVQNLKKDAFGHARLGGIGNMLGEEIERRTGFETRVTVLGHVQRGGTPTAFDRVLASRFGVAAVELVVRGEFGKMVSLQGNKILAVSLDEAVKEIKTVDKELFSIAQVFFG